MIDKSLLGYRKHVLDEFAFENGQVLLDVEVEYTTRGTPTYDENGNINNAIIYCHRFNGNCLSIGDLSQLIGPESELSDFNFFHISITSLGYPESCSPSTTKLKFDFPKYTIKDRVNFKRKFLADVFNIEKVLGILGVGVGGYEAYTWGCEYPDEMEFLMIGSSSYKTNNYRYILSKGIESIILSSDAYMEGKYTENISKIMSSINLLIYSQYFSKKAFQNFSQDEIDILMDTFIDEGMSIDIYDLKYRNDAVLSYDVEDKLSNIRAKTWITTTTDDIYYSPEFDAYPLKDKIENLKITSFDAEDFTYNDDYSIFVDQFKEFLEEFKK
ncbi:homoserine acetyltransferase [Methanobrevibacter sp.]|uniref:homoserine acetyltransferase n=1 Tax=Methanobrevibacter sp. TaxID=66852 RepID=UPI003863D16D